MKMFDEVAIISARDTTDLVADSDALRRMLEAWCLRVDYHQLVHRRQAIDLFRSGGPSADVTILFAHGLTTEDGPTIRFNVRDNDNPDPNPTEGWYMTTLDLSPANIPDVVKGPHGVWICNACAGGDERLAQAFLDAGASAYIAQLGTNYDTIAGMTFLVALFHFLLEDRDAQRTLSLEEAVQRAAAIDPQWPSGTGGWRCYTKP